MGAGRGKDAAPGFENPIANDRLIEQQQSFAGASGLCAPDREPHKPEAPAKGWQTTARRPSMLAAVVLCLVPQLGDDSFARRQAASAAIDTLLPAGLVYVEAAAAGDLDL